MPCIPRVKIKAMRFCSIWIKLDGRGNFESGSIETKRESAAT
ncbi:hypothetical protein LKMONMHP_1090 [Methylobacterium organophilum]|uniref:Uncharacterized protein n=1 Tax=Methylobacterium organophilum TaxID=410 RepID=A0ABQ4T7J9_METOR|nr:hypothetical protein LKMONMHP_1090 [Methylobacterium organophilum]